MENLEKILTFIKDERIISPNPRNWKDLWEKVFDGFNEPWKNKKDKMKCFPLILNGWVGSNDGQKNERFIYSIEYFYTKYPEKRKIIEDFILKSDRDIWYKG